MKKRTFLPQKAVILLALLLVAAMLAGCEKNKTPNPPDGTETIEPGGKDSDNDPVNNPDQETDQSDQDGQGDREALENEAKDDEPYTDGMVNVRNPQTINWDSDKSIVQTAMDNQTMIIQFMSGEGCYIGGSGSNTAKWGDAVLLVFPNGETMLIDAGMQDYGSYLVENLKKLGVEKLDYCMMSHQHEDHYAGFLPAGGVFDSFEVGTFLYSGIYSAAYGARAKIRIEQVAELNGTKLVTVARGDEYWFGDVKMTVLSPEPGRAGGVSYTNSDESVNADSVVVRFDYGECSYLTAGDLYAQEEKNLMSRIDTSLLEVDIAKMDHHGRTTSSCDAWCEALNAKIAVATGSIAVTEGTYHSYAKLGTVPYVDTYDGFVRVEAKKDGSFTVTTSRKRDHETFDLLDKKDGIERKSQY